MTKDRTSEFADEAAAEVGGSPTPAGIPADDRSFFGHPRGLATLFFTEMWERFSYYGIRGLLILFMTAAVADGGLGFDVPKAGAIYGLFTGFVYLLALPGGWVADKVMGQRQAVLWGGLLIAAGNFMLATPGLLTFYGGLVAIILGTGLLKPNVSTIVGELYPEDQPARRDGGFTIFYMGINIGAFVAPLIVGFLGENINWHLGFAASGIGMLLGLLQFLLMGKSLGEAGVYRGTSEARQRGIVLLVGGMLVTAAIFAGLWLLSNAGAVNITIGGIANAGGVIIVSMAILYFLYMLVGGGLDAVEKKRVITIFVLFVFSALFWSGFEQAGSSLNLVAERLTDRTYFGWEMPASWFQSVNPIWIVSLAPVFAWLWVFLAKRDKEPSSPAKFAVGLILLGAGFLVMSWGTYVVASGGELSPMWLISVYFLHTCGELSLSPVGLSMITKLAPARFVGQMMGVWFMSVSLGNLMAGLVAGYYEAMSLPMLFGAVAGTTIGGGLLLALLVPVLRKLMSGVH
jgi:POT family proton-dependent oligopeptide transporter